jgi:type IV pilus assembly protein PilV
MRGRSVARPVARSVASSVARPVAHSSAGFTLVEVLVALFVVALGVAGAAAVQAVAVRMASEAARLSDGLRLAASLAERMRANPAAMALPDAANPYLQFDVEAGAVVPAPVSCYGAAGCDPLQLARFDLGETAALLASRFPGARMRICRDDQAPDPAGLLAWACSGDPAAPVAVKLGWRGRPGEPDAPAVFLTLGAGAP